MYNVIQSNFCISAKLEIEPKFQIPFVYFFLFGPLMVSSLASYSLLNNGFLCEGHKLGFKPLSLSLSLSACFSC